jgi:hypothetical protein
LITLRETLSKLTAPKGQTATHILQPMHLSSSIITLPRASSRAMADTGHIDWHGAASQCEQAIGMPSPSMSHLTIDIRLW